MIRGSSSLWVTEFQRLDEEVLRRVVCVWWDVVERLPVRPCEDQVTKELVERLFSWGRRKGLHVEFQFVPFDRAADGTIGRSRFVDVAVIARGYDRSIYLAYECKKLNVRHTDGIRRSQADRYVGKDGMMRFVTEKYAKDLPIGCMLGYVMDGDLQWACEKVIAAIVSQAAALGLEGVPISIDDLELSSPSVGAIERFVTQHKRNGRSLEMRHTLLPFVRSASAGTAK